PEILEHYHSRIRFVLEDEAQDSTPLQNRLLELLASGHGNLVRVGDPNQAILASFTSNDPRFFREFCSRSLTVAMAESSRSARPILELANSLVAIAQLHPDPVVRQALGGDPILPATAGPQNPTEAQLAWTVYPGKTEEIAGVLTAVRQHLRDHPDHTCAILCFTNSMIHKESDGTGFLPAARALGLPLRGDEAERPDVAAQVAVFEHATALLDASATDPVGTLAKLAQVRVTALGLPPWRAPGQRGLAALRQLGITSLVLPPALRPARPSSFAEPAYAAVIETAVAIENVLKWGALPLTDLLLAIAQALLGGDPGAMLLAARLARLAMDPPSDPSLGPLAGLRARIADLKTAGQLDRLAPGVSDLREPKSGQVVVTTLHKAKGAEYDAVWIPNAGYSFKSESHVPWTPQEVRAASISSLLAEQAGRGEPLDAQGARIAYQQSVIAERLRLLYVGITRAKRRLALSCYAYDQTRTAPWHILELAKSIERP
ncbi:MAG: ATP-dependent helicase, partial [Cyanobacteria bacterium REEB65]|nr:ATP-dependent helicase [Cyanobacteria bacterium REEB65]